MKRNISDISDILTDIKNRAEKLLKLKLGNSSADIKEVNGKISLVDNSDIPIASITLVEDEQDIKRRKTRQCQTSSEESCHVVSIIVKLGHQGKGLGTLLLIYGISKFFIENSTISFITLDDESEQSQSLKNIYASLGFMYTRLIQLASDGKNVEGSSGWAAGPERSGTKADFISRSLNILEEKENRWRQPNEAGQMHKKVRRRGKPKTKKRRYKRRKKSKRRRRRRRRKSRKKLN